MSQRAAAPADLASAQALLDAARPAEALLLVETTLALQPNDPAAARLRAEIVAAIRIMDPALAKLELAAALHSERADLQLELGHTYGSLERLMDAERCFKRALELSPDFVDAHASLGALYLSVEIRDGAEHHCCRALALDPAHPMASQTLAAILEARGEAAAAEEQFARAYGRQALFVQTAPMERLRVLVLATTSAGNIPYKHVMPAHAYTRLVWYMEHARETERPPADRYDLVFNVIGDADLAQPSEAAVDAFLASCPKPALNLPAAVARTRRDRLGDLLAGAADVVVPRTVRIEAAALAAAPLSRLAAEQGFEGPLLARPIGSHGGRGLERAATPAALEGVAVEADLDYYLTAYVDFSSPDGLFRKYRMFFIDGEPLPYHLAISERWLVHHDTSGMHEHVARREEEARFLADPEAAIGARGLAAIVAIGRQLGLDYCGVDFSLLPSGEILVFEANATMLAHPEDPAGPYAHKNAYVAQIAEAFQALLARRAAGAGARAGS